MAHANTLQASTYGYVTVTPPAGITTMTYVLNDSPPQPVTATPIQMQPADQVELYDGATIAGEFTLIYIGNNLGLNILWPYFGQYYALRASGFGSSIKVWYVSMSNQNKNVSLVQ